MPKFHRWTFPANTPASFSGQFVAFQWILPPLHGSPLLSLRRGIFVFYDLWPFNSFLFVFLFPVNFPMNNSMDSRSFLCYRSSPSLLPSGCDTRRHVPRPMPRRSPCPLWPPPSRAWWMDAATVACGQELLPLPALSHSRARPCAAVAWHVALPGRPAKARSSPSLLARAAAAALPQQWLRTYWTKGRWQLIYKFATGH